MLEMLAVLRPAFRHAWSCPQAHCGGHLEFCLHEILKISLGNSSLQETRELRDICLFQDNEKGLKERVLWAKHDHSFNTESPWEWEL